MKKRLLFFILLSLIYSCGDNSKSTYRSTIQELKSTNDSNSLVIVKDSSYYSVSFLKSLEHQKSIWKFNLDSEKFIIDDLDTITFPDLLPINKVIYLTGKNADLKVNLYIKRILISTIDYKIEVTQGNHPPVIKSGLADLSPFFFIQSKTDEIDSTSYNPELTEYWDNTGDYLTSIKVGKDSDRMIIGKVECKLNSFEINQDNCPILKLGSLASLYAKIQAPFELYLGKKLPPFNIKISDSKSFSNKDFNNKIVFINFWAEHCAPCISEIDGLKQLHSKFINNSNFLFVSFSSDEDSTIKRFSKKNKLTYKVYHLEKEEFSRLNYRNGIPTSVILDRNGIIKYFVCGGPSEKEQATEYIMTIVYPKILQLIENK